MKRNGTKQDLSTILETNDKKQQAARAGQLKVLAQMPVAGVVVLYDPRFDRCEVVPYGRRLTPEQALEVLERAKNEVIKAMMQAKEVERVPNPTGVPGVPAAGAGGGEADEPDAGD